MYNGNKISYLSESILGKIQEAGFTIAMSKEITLSRDQAEAFYSEHKDSDFFETLVTNMARFVEPIFIYIICCVKLAP